MPYSYHNIYVFCEKITCIWHATLCALHAQLILYHLCFLPRSLNLFDSHIKRVTCTTIILLSTLSAQRLHGFDTHTMRAKCPTIILSSLLSAKRLHLLTPTLCVLHELLISYHLCFLPKGYMYSTPTLFVLHALLLSSHLWFLPKRLHSFDTHITRATCPTNIISSMLSEKNITFIWHPHYACYMPY
jgi:hypothetical protein